MNLYDSPKMELVDAYNMDHNLKLLNKSEYSVLSMSHSI